MKRRSFLKSAASIVPAAALHNIVDAQTPAATQSNALHVVGAAEDRFGHPHTLGFSSLTFKVSGSETAGGLFIIEHRHLLPGGPSLHYHLNQEEWFYVMEGEVAFQVGEQRLHLHAGESVLAPRRIPLTFSTVGEAPGHMLIAFTPAGKMEAYFRDAETAGPSAFAPAFMRQYEMEYVGPSPFWRPS